MYGIIRDLIYEQQEAKDADPINHS